VVKKKIATFMKRLCALLISLFAVTLIVFLLVLFFFGNENETLDKGGKYFGYGFSIENKGVFTEMNYSGRKLDIYQHKKPSGALSDAETYPVSEDKKLTIQMVGDDMVYIEIDFDRIGILRKKFRKLF